MPPVTLTPTQASVLTHAIDHTQGQICWFPDSLHGGARQKVLTALASRSLITHSCDTWQVTDAGYRILERPLPRLCPQTQSECETQTEPGYPLGSEFEAGQVTQSGPDTHTEQTLVAAVDLVSAPPEPVDRAEPSTPPARGRANSKQAQVLALLQRPEGATISQICELTQWLSHTVRGALAGTFKKKLGLTITSEKPADGERIYRCGQINETA